MSRALSSLIVIALLSFPALSQTAQPSAAKPATKKAAKAKPQTKEEADAEADADADSAEGLSPYIEVEKYDAAKPLKERTDDRISVFLKFNTNQFDAEDQVTQATFNFSNSSDVNAGLEYVKSFSDNLHLVTMLMLSHYAASENLLVVPNIAGAKKDQAAFALGLRYAFTPDNYFEFLLNYRPHYYLKNNPVSSKLDLEHNLSPSAFVGMKNFFYETKDASVGLDLGFELITNTGDSGRNSTNSFAYQAGLIYRQNFSSGDNVAVEFTFKDETTDTVDYSLRDHAFSLSFMYSLPY